MMFFLLFVPFISGVKGPPADLDDSEVRFIKEESDISKDVKFNPFASDARFVIQEEVPDSEEVDPEIKIVTEYIEKSRSKTKIDKMILIAYQNAFNQYKNKFINLFLDEEEIKNKVKQLSKANPNLKHFTKPIHSKFNMNRAPKVSDIPCPKTMTTVQCKTFRQKKHAQYKNQLSSLKCPKGLNRNQCLKQIAPKVRKLRLELLGLI
ncbi:hypothetical protein TRFO_34733 [Tritrichomonas foetus]|uniref:Uncharacterized protein n=1 Tax=Tritrichomonas foetus TaxID=1144522 RepID=A0A1J4JN52_9EUKA|nr:hypothetical protein TRFO_34733 [Tritrichomonas foetus]|eukprot:OHS98933.1 hypothetical protein TRFO_34733 [Tritrichomonas foetus]